MHTQKWMSSTSCVREKKFTTHDLKMLFRSRLESVIFDWLPESGGFVLLAVEVKRTHLQSADANRAITAAGGRNKRESGCTREAPAGWGWSVSSMIRHVSLDNVWNVLRGILLMLCFENWVTVTCVRRWFNCASDASKDTLSVWAMCASVC